ncbi:MAG: NRDE family protein [bacterium]|nr:NRDE family protein [bacterium]
MCLILFAWRTHPHYQLILAANRDEFYNRPTAPVHWWPESPDLLAGKDLKAGGTWMGIAKTGKFAALTNYRGTKIPRRGDNAPSRGQLVSGYLQSHVPAKDYLETLQTTGSQYNGFNLILGDADHLYYFSNVNESHDTTPLEPGIYGLSNDVLDTPWPKVVNGKQQLQRQIENSAVNASHSTHPDNLPGTLFSILADQEKAPKDRLPDTGVGQIKERMLSPLFIKTPIYGTRSSTVLLVDHQNSVTIEDHSFVPPAENRFQFITQL